MNRLRISKQLKVLLPIGIGIILAVLISNVAPGRWSSIDEKIAAVKEITAFYQQPILVGRIELSGNDAPLLPYSLSLTRRYLYVSYLGNDRIDLFDRRLERVKTLHLSHGGAASITGIAVDDNYIYVADNLNGEVRIHNYDGNLIDVFRWLPGKAGRLRPHGLTLHDGRLYVTDVEHKKLLVISVSDIEGITENGELLFSVPYGGSETTLLRYPASASVSPDGRILVSDLETGDVNVFTCNGIYAYRFTPPDGILTSSNGIAMDDLPSPVLLEEDEKIFDPSGVRKLGRFHVADRNGEIVVFDALGNYVLRYGEGDLQSPNGIAVDTKRKIIIIADTDASALVVYKY